MERAATPKPPSQVFVSRNALLCNNVQQEIPEPCRKAMQFLEMTGLLERLGEALADRKKEATPSVNFSDFENWWKIFGAKHCGESALTHGLKFKR